VGFFSKDWEKNILYFALGMGPIVGTIKKSPAICELSL